MTSPSYRELDIPASVQPWRIRSVEESRERFRTETVQDGDVLRWRSNNRAVPTSIFRENYCEASAAQTAAENADNDAFLSDYRRRMANHVPDAEQLFEMRAAFGTGVTVVNAITGRKTRI